MYFKMFICIIVLEKYFIRIYSLKWQCIAIDDSIFSSTHIHNVKGVHHPVATMFNDRKCMRIQKNLHDWCFFFLQVTWWVDVVVTTESMLNCAKHKRFKDEKVKQKKTLHCAHFVLTIKKNRNNFINMTVTMRCQCLRKIPANERRVCLLAIVLMYIQRVLFSVFDFFTFVLSSLETTSMLMTSSALVVTHCEFNLLFYL